MIPIIVQSEVVKAFTSRRSWRRSKLKMFSNLKCGHQVCHGAVGVRRYPPPAVGESIVCRRCTMAARRAAAR